MQQRLAILISAASLAITAACSHSDAGITTAVKAKMAADSQVKASEINVDTHNRVVTLNGTVGSQTEKDRDEEEVFHGGFTVAPAFGPG